MTETEKKALALVNEVFQERDLSLDSYLNCTSNSYHEALYRAIKQHEAFRQEVSDAVEKLIDRVSVNERQRVELALSRFIIAKPDHVQDALEEVFAGDSLHIDCAKELRDALAARGLQIVEVGHD